MTDFPPSSPPSAPLNPPPPSVDLTELEPEPSKRIADKTQTVPLPPALKEYDPEQAREGTRGDLARGLLWLLTLTIGGMLVFVGLGRLDGMALAQSVFPSLVTLAGTALGFYFGSAARNDSGNTPPAK